MTLDDDFSREPTPEDWQQILALLAASLDVPGRLRLVQYTILTSRELSRLKFNSVVPVRACTMDIVVESFAGGLYRGEIDLFFWQQDEEWELNEAALTLALEKR